MIIYKCILTGDEMFSDIYKITESEDGVFYRVEGKVICRTDKIDDSLLGANASAEEACDVSEDVAVSGVDIILNHKLVETSFQKKDYQNYLKGYMKAVKEKLKEVNPDRVDRFQSSVTEGVKGLLKNFKNYQFFIGESMNPDGIVGLLDYKDDGVTPYMIFFKDGLEIEKC